MEDYVGVLLYITYCQTNTNFNILTVLPLTIILMIDDDDMMMMMVMIVMVK